MAALSNRNHGGFYLYSLLFAVCVFFFTFLALRVDAVKAGGRGPSIDLSSRIKKSDDKSSRLSETCSNEDISVNQNNAGPWTGGDPGSSNGISVFEVEILNECSSGCSIANIHVNCGDFASQVEVNPEFFRKLAVGDCLVNDGQKLDVGQIVSFSYANTFSYPLTVSSVTCVP